MQNMPVDWVNVGSPSEWALSLGVMAGQWLIEIFLNYGKNFQTKITLDVLENMSDVGCAKEAIRNIFQNLGIVAALILTIAFAMLFLGDHMEDGTDTPKTAHAFVALAGYATLQAIRAMIESVVNLVYTEPLTSPEVIRFIITGPGAIGAPVMAIFFSVVSIMIGTVLWLAQMYSLAAAVAFGAFALKGVASTIRFSYKRAVFSTVRSKKRSKSWLWAEGEDPPPSAISKKCSAKEIAMMRLRAREALLYEQAAEAALKDASPKVQDLPLKAAASAGEPPAEAPGSAIGLGNLNV